MNASRLLISMMLLMMCFALVPISAQEDTLNMTLDKALPFFKSRVEKNPQSPYANFGLARSYYLAKDYRASAAICKKFIYKKNEYRSDFNILYAMSLIALEQQDKAVDILSAAMVEFPDNCQMFYYRALAYYKNSELSRAFSDARKCVELKEEFYKAHLLLGIIMYEKNNDRNSAAPLIYALFRNAESPWSNKVVFIIHALLNYKHDRLLIPLREYRFDIIEVEDIIEYYCSNYDYKGWLPTVETFVPMTYLYIKDVTPSLAALDKCYYDFYSKLLASPHMVTFGYYILKSLGMKEVEEWYRLHSDELSDFADWLDSTLKE